ncbi:MAG: TCR/Tet family MFS transporter [Ahniella sp.]|nr:TCR/Tet family MFS transporter [Ahniella sp.]
MTSNVSPARPAAVRFVLITVALDMLALGVVIPVLPDLFKSFLGGDTVSAAHYYGIAGVLWASMQFLFSPLLGALSDRFGRRKIILFSNAGLGLDYVLMALSGSLLWLFIARAVSGICAASVSTASAYIADVTPPEKRAAAFGSIGAAFGIGFVLGPAVGGTLGAIDLHLPFWVAAGLSLANFCYGWFVLPESLPPEKRAGFSWARANPVGGLIWLAGHGRLLGLAGVHFLNSLAHYVLPATFALYAGYRYQWSPSEIGLTLMMVGVCSAAVQGGLVRVVIPRIGERHALMLGLLFGGLGFALYGLANQGTWFLAAIPVMAIWGFAGPAMQGLMSGRVESTDQGKLQGMLSSVMGVAGMIGPGLFTQIFAASIHPDAHWHVPGAAFLLSAAFLAAALLLAYRVANQTVPLIRPDTEGTVRT